MEKNGILTMGLDSKDVDWQTVWRNELAKDDLSGKEGRPRLCNQEASWQPITLCVSSIFSHDEGPGQVPKNYKIGQQKCHDTQN